MSSPKPAVRPTLPLEVIVLGAILPVVRISGHLNVPKPGDIQNNWSSCLASATSLRTTDLMGDPIWPQFSHCNLTTMCLCPPLLLILPLRRTQSLLHLSKMVCVCMCVFYPWSSTNRIWNRKVLTLIPRLLHPWYFLIYHTGRTHHSSQAPPSSHLIHKHEMTYQGELGPRHWMKENSSYLHRLYLTQTSCFQLVCEYISAVPALRACRCHRYFPMTMVTLEYLNLNLLLKMVWDLSGVQPHASYDFGVEADTQAAVMTDLG